MHPAGEQLTPSMGEQSVTFDKEKVQGAKTRFSEFPGSPISITKQIIVSETL